MLISNQASKRNTGSAAKLKRNCYLLNIYLNDKETDWMQEEKSTVARKMDQAINFIKIYAEKYNVDVSISQGVIDNIMYPGIITTDMFENLYWTEEVFPLVGYSTGNEAVKIIKRENINEIAFMFHVKKAGTSYNISYCFGCDNIFFAERSVMFTSYDNEIQTYAGSYAHEILHNFGAGELYFPFDFNNERYSVASEYFPDDVMFRADEDINNLSIGDYTAYRIGWLKHLEKKYKIFEDWC